MERDKEIHNFNHVFNLVERKNVSLDSEEFLIETVMGYVVLKGEGLELIKLDTHDGVVTIKGLVNSFAYIEDGNKKNKENSVISRLFKWV